MIRHANARLERQDPKWKEFYLPATKLRLSSYITDSLNPETCRMKLSFMNYALARITSTTANTTVNSYAVLAMYSGARNLHVGVVLFNLCKSQFLFFCQYLCVCTTEARVTQWSTDKKLTTEMSRTSKSDRNITKNIFASVNRCANCVEDLFTSSVVAAQTTALG